MAEQQHSWTHLLRTEGPECLAWIVNQGALETNFKLLADALRSLLFRWVRTSEVAHDVWVSAPAVIVSCNKRDTYRMPGAALAYAWLHLLDRYVRSWRALEVLLEGSCIPMGRHGVRVLDVGTGPGPSSFAIHDFYESMNAFARVKANSKWNQPVEIECVESDGRTNSLRHNLAELLHGLSPSKSQSILAMCSAFPDFGKISPVNERRRAFEQLRRSEYSYYDDLEGEEGSELVYSTAEANKIAQSLRRYRLLVFSNFLTTVTTVSHFEQNLKDTFDDAGRGTVILTVGGKGPPYPDVYKSLETLALPAGFQPVVTGARVSSEADELLDMIHTEAKQFYAHLRQLSPRMDGEIQESKKHQEARESLRDYFETTVSKAPVSEVRAYRKY